MEQQQQQQRGRRGDEDNDDRDNYSRKRRKTASPYISGECAILDLPSNVRIVDLDNNPIKIPAVVDICDIPLIKSVITVATLKINKERTEKIQVYIAHQESKEEYVIHLCFPDDVGIDYVSLSTIKKLNVSKIGKMEMGYDDTVNKIYLTIHVASKNCIVRVKRATIIILEHDDSTYLPADDTSKMGKLGEGTTYKRTRTIKNNK